jgi:hypothetical protein
MTRTRVVVPITSQDYSLTLSRITAVLAHIVVRLPTLYDLHISHSMLVS